MNSSLKPGNAKAFIDYTKRLIHIFKKKRLLNAVSRLCSSSFVNLNSYTDLK